MTTEERRLHVTFGASAAGSLKQALATLEIAETIAFLEDDYSIGPINPGHAEQRAEWERAELDESDPRSISAEVTDFWESVSAWPSKLVAWMSSRSVRELCGLHALLSRLPDAKLDVIDVANVDFRPDNAPQYDERQAFAIVRADRIVEHSLTEFAKPFSDVERMSSLKIWNQLRTENAPLRVLTGAGLSSAPITYFDDRIRALITNEWQRSARVVGAMLDPSFHSDTFIFVRLLRLLDVDGEIEGRNDDGHEAGWSMRSSWVRRRPNLNLPGA
jgi:hypothetical protein